MGSVEQLNFSAPPEIASARGLLLDFDGTIIDSTAAIIKHWHKQGEIMGVDPNVILASSHGRRSIDVIKMYDPSKANWDYIIHQESLIPKEFGQDAEEIPGARKLLTTLDDANVPWAVVTSGTRGLVTGWIEVLKLAHPRTIVVAEDVENGKPDPTCYLLGRRRLRLPETAEMIVFEDAPAGVCAGKAAGFKVIALSTTHTVGQLKEAGADWIVEDLRSVKLKNFKDGVIQVEIINGLVEAS
ncbi:glycerol 3-phosphatase 1 [Cladophialophora psammophila CBS 110553]|uniref:Glycerol 3-phosphatase 1 n=1 Tax=Cladophialophora psammophila CBS 110553 TaxID=1182543 RepID=W9WUU1_9EURO|nr:glycerol 3-phosphatase 1 [Cladophialophora psammophila CBS 110553]EXJ68386.1 glycerol 3-phosphatase 1 [Cladophialophora psammophila CBS 110553]